MKKTYIKKVLFILLLGFCAAGCHDFLEEDPKGDITTNVVYSTEAGYEALITSCYSILHDVANARNLVLMGTDLFTQTPTMTDNVLNDYSASCLNATNGNISAYWDMMYKGIQWCNTAIDRKNDVEGMAETTLNQRYAEAVFLRALYHFFLVQQFGDIPYRDYEVKGTETDVARAPEATVYANIISDLESIKNSLPKLSGLDDDDIGRASWEAVRHLMAQVYLTRGWDYNGKLGVSDSDFTKAAEYADEVIGSMGDLTLEPAEIYFNDGNIDGEHNDDNSEVIFAFRFSEDQSFNTDLYGSAEDGNSYHGAFNMNLGGLHGILDNNSFYGIFAFYTASSTCGSNCHQPTQYASDILHPEMPGFDKRYSAFYRNVITAEIDEEVTDGDYVYTGDTIVYFPGVEEGESYADGTVFHSADILANNPHALIYTPSMYDQGSMNDGIVGFLPLWKHFEPYATDVGNGTRDLFYMRLAGTYLLSAEAHLKAGNATKAAERYTAVRARAIDLSKSPSGVDPDARTATDITVEDILDERARELAGEYHRWFDLKRTKTLYERVIKYNLKANQAGVLVADGSDKYYLRPIPQDELENVTNPDFKQNAGY
ncbi:RagB/SusD family nutrient uptake outer membrane protein [Maribellus maritimus]|uniref:RagB/SusD family nutrient uptake outer membrane protein n=1 Tax=Maribellus maritimus TaxID=2870838 RepID=UPI001EEC4D52|nr:RagB/SusD family nutrient uptake outer membrane protein [Maribellus maritimus]MCG6190910.1 RagB/SusD family nutrient uptake outer membrane protein [Maribellus maritimus]